MPICNGECKIKTTVNIENLIKGSATVEPCEACLYTMLHTKIKTTANKKVAYSMHYVGKCGFQTSCS